MGNKQSAFENLLKEILDRGWRLLLALSPSAYQVYQGEAHIAGILKVFSVLLAVVFIFKLLGAVIDKSLLKSIAKLEFWFEVVLGALILYFFLSILLLFNLGDGCYYETIGRGTGANICN